jgi:hypothetical protein
MRVIVCIEQQDVAKKILSHLGLPAEPLPTARGQAPPVTLELFPAPRRPRFDGGPGDLAV